MHRDQEAEQAYLDTVYRCLDQGHALAERNIAQHQAGDLAAHRAMHRALAILKDVKGQGQLIHSRLDRLDEGSRPRRRLGGEVLSVEEAPASGRVVGRW